MVTEVRGEELSGKTD